jgi:hypothetical protein
MYTTIDASTAAVFAGAHSHVRARLPDSLVWRGFVELLAKRSKPAARPHRISNT